jgi:hypothetical protein
MSKQHYVYLLQNRINGMCYIGVRSCKGTIWNDNYMGSSTVMTQEDKDNCNKIILARFDNRKDAATYEIEMHNKFDVGRNPLFYNRAKQTSIWFDSTGVSANFSEEHKEFLRKKRKEYNQTHGNPGRSHDPEVKEKLSAAGKAYYSTHTHNSKGKKLSEEHKKAIGEGLKGNIHPESTKEKIRNTHRANATKHKGFVPWWYEVDGVRTELADKTIAQFAEEQKVAFHIVKDRFKKEYQGKAKQSEPLKGYTFGRITK